MHLVQFKIVAMCLEKPIYTLTRLIEVSPMLPLKQFQSSSCSSSPFLVLSKKIDEHFPFPCLSPPGDQWCDVLSFVPTGSVSSCSTLEIFWDTNHLWLLLYPLVFPAPGQCTQKSFQRWMSNIDTCQSGLSFPCFTLWTSVSKKFFSFSCIDHNC